MGEFLTVGRVADAPHLLERSLRARDGLAVTFRPLAPGDVALLGEFLGSLSAQTRVRWNLESYDVAMAQEHCAAVGRYDKLRMIAEAVVAGRMRIIALMEFSFSVPAGDRARFLAYGIELDEAVDCRFAPCVRDDFQRKGIASMLMPSVIDIAREFGKRRILLWGGVYADNAPALAFYTRHGFVEVGRFTSESGESSVDFMLWRRVQNVLA